VRNGMLSISAEKVDAEVDRARTKFPPSKKETAALMDALVEEVGELAKARLEHGPKSEQAHVEASHVACVAIRMMEEMGYITTPAKTCGEEEPKGRYGMSLSKKERRLIREALWNAMQWNLSLIDAHKDMENWTRLFNRWNRQVVEWNLLIEKMKDAAQERKEGVRG